MRKQMGMPLAAAVSLMLLTFAGCGKDNIFSFAHKAGGDSSTTALTSDASVALRDKDYAKALEYYSKILDADPANAEAIYGYAAATLADAGLDIASLVSNLVKQQAGAPSRLAPSLALAARTPSNNENLLPQSIIDNLPAIKAAIDKIMAEGKLPRIIKGRADGKIDPDNPDVNINLAFCLVLRAAIKVQESGVMTFDKDYQVVFSGDPLAYKSVAIDAGKDIISAYHRLMIVYRKLNLGSDASLTSIRDDIRYLYDGSDNNDSLKRKFSITTELDIDHDYLLD